MLVNTFIKQNQKYQTNGRTGYASKNYVNPFFEKKKKAVREGIFFNFFQKLKIALIIIFALALVCAMLALYSGFFTIKTIEINGDGRVNRDDVRQLVNDQINENYIKVFPQKNLFLFNQTKLLNKLETLYAFNSLNVIKKFPNKLIVSFKEKVYAFILVEDNKFYYADESGSIIEEVSPLEITNKAYLIINNESDQKIFEKNVTFNKDYIGYALKIFSEFKKIENKFKVSQVLVDNDINSLKVVLENGPKIYFNINTEIGEQLKRLIIIKDEKIKDNFFGKEYIDLRYGDSVYYK